MLDVYLTCTRCLYTGRAALLGALLLAVLWAKRHDTSLSANRHLYGYSCILKWIGLWTTAILRRWFPLGHACRKVCAHQHVLSRSLFTSSNSDMLNSLTKWTIFRSISAMILCLLHVLRNDSSHDDTMALLLRNYNETTFLSTINVPLVLQVEFTHDLL